jgi:hypothetical protein
VFSPSSGFEVAVQLENDAQASFPVVVVGTVAANQWTKISVPIASLDPAGLAFDRLDISDYTGTSRTYYVDELRLVGTASATPTATPTSSPTKSPTQKPTVVPTAPPTATPTVPAPASTPTATSTPTSTKTPPPTPTPTNTPTPTQAPQATPTAPSSADLLVYGDALVPPWNNASWSASVAYGNTMPTFSGRNSIRVVESGWGALSVRRGKKGAPPLDPSLYRSLDFEVYSSTAGFNLAVRLESDSGPAFPEIVVGVIPVNQWVKISVPIADLDPNGTGFNRLDVRDYGGANRTYYVDDLRLVGR